jgi:16S rRNA (cytosine967-C5)-methyltransferase
MQTSSLIGHIAEVFSEFRGNPAVPADAVIRRFFLNRKYLGSSDRRFIGDVYFGIVKNWRRLEALVVDCFEDHEVTPARIIAAYLIVFLSQAQDEVIYTFEAIPLQAPISSSALQLLADRERETARLATLPREERLAIFFSYPIWFVARLGTQYGEESLEGMLAAMNGEAPISLRANTLTIDRESLKIELANEGCEVAISQIASDALIFPKRVNLSNFSAYRRGAFEVQDEASQLVAPLAGIRKTAIKALDACAGAGGKTLHLAALMKNHGEIFATDVDDRKLEELKLRARRSGAQNIRIVRLGEREKFLGADKTNWFDLVLLDVPCTGTGTVRRNPGIKWLLTEQMLEELVQKQRTILEENSRFVKPGGTLLYATCSILKEEGEQQTEWFTSAHPEFQIEETLRTHPERDGCDGFFAARLRKSPTA